MFVEFDHKQYRERIEHPRECQTLENRYIFSPFVVLPFIFNRYLEQMHL